MVADRRMAERASSRRPGTEFDLEFVCTGPQTDAQSVPVNGMHRLRHRAGAWDNGGGIILVCQMIWIIEGFENMEDEMETRFVIDI